jgi:hypothetical protein
VCRLGQSAQGEQYTLRDGLFDLSGELESTLSIVRVIKEVYLVCLGLREGQAEVSVSLVRWGETMVWRADDSQQE